MDRFLRSIQQFLAELRRRNVYRVAVTYVVVGFFVIEAADLTLTRLGLPGWTVTFVVVLVGLGFPIALVLAWALEVTPEGVRVDESEAAPEDVGPPASATPNVWIGASILVMALVGAWWLFPGSPDGMSEAAKEPQVVDRSVAVLPFEPFSSREQSRTFARGVHGDLVTRLSNISDLQVTPRTSVQKYRGTELSLPAIADSLNVRWVVEGEVQQAAGQIQIHAKLIDPERDANVWADDYQRDLSAEDLFAIQGEITREIAGALEAKLTVGEQERIAGAPTENLEAYRLYVRGRNLLDQRTAASIDSARTYFRRALQKDSTYALAWVGMADARAFEPDYGAGESEAFARGMRAALPEAKTAVRRALELDPSLAEAHASLGLIYYFEQLVNPNAQNGPEALRALRRAVEMKPSYPEAQHWLALWNRDLGRPEQALRHFTLSVDLNPENVAARRSMVSVLLANGKYREALTEARRFQEMYPDREAGTALVAATLVHLGQWEELRETVRPYLSDPAESPSWAMAYMGLANVAAGDSASAQRQLQRLRGSELGNTAFAIVLLEAALGNDEEAVTTLLEKGLQAQDDHSREDHDINLGVLPRSGVVGVRYLYPDVLRSVRADPRYDKLIRQLNQQWGLNPDGSIPEEMDTSTEPQSDA